MLRQRLSGPGLLDRQGARSRRRALVAADRPRRDEPAGGASTSCRRASASPATSSPPGSQRLVEEDILERRAYQRSPERYEYFLTEKGLDLWPALIALLGWGDRHSPTPEGPPMLIVHKECGGRVSDRGICESCGEVLEARDARALPGPGVAPHRLRTPRRSRRASVGRTASRRRRSQEDTDGHRSGAPGTRQDLHRRRVGRAAGRRDARGDQLVDRGGDGDDRRLHRRRRRPRGARRPRGLRVLVADLARGARRLPGGDLRRARRAHGGDRRRRSPRSWACR